MPTSIPTRARSLAAVAALAAAGCGTYTTYQSAEPLAPGRWQVGGAIGTGAFVDPPSDSRTPTATVEATARRGVGGDTDVGAKLYAFGLEGQVRHRFVHTEGGWSVAVLGAVGGLRSNGRRSLPDAFTGHLRATLAVTARTSPRWAFSFGPLTTASVFLPAGGGSARGVLGGAFGNAQLTFGSGGRWHVVPELSVHRTLTGDVPVDGSVFLLGAALVRDL